MNGRIGCRYYELVWLAGRRENALRGLSAVDDMGNDVSLELGSMYLLENRDEDATGAWFRFISRTRSPLPPMLLLRDADIAYKHAADSEAARFYLLAAKLDPGNATAWRGLGDSLIRLGLWAAAERAYNQAKTISGPTPWLIEELWRYGDLQVRRGQRESAERALELALRLNPKVAQAWVAYGDLMLAVGLTATGTRAFERALDLDRESALANTGYAICLLISDPSDTCAPSFFERAVYLDAHGKNANTLDSGPWLYQKITNAYLSSRNYRGAMAWAERGAHAFSRHPISYYMAAVVARKAGSHLCALKWLQEAHARDPGNPTLLSALEQTYRQLGASSMVTFIDSLLTARPPH